MKRLFIRLVQAVLKNKYGTTRYYSFFYFLYLQGLRGMDHGYSYIYPENSGEYDVLEKVDRYYRLKSESILFFDVGANTGYFAKRVLEIFQTNAKVYCFEPSSFTYKQLIANLGNSVNAFPFALSNRVGKSKLHSDRDGSGMASLEDTSYAPPFGIASPVEESIDTDTIDDFCNAQGIQKIHFLKMDVEGHEFSVLEGAKQKLKARSIDFIQFEFGRTNIDAGVSLKKFYKMLHDDYYIYRIIRGGLIPQFEYNYEYEVYLGTNFLAINKLLCNDSDIKILTGSSR